MTPNTRKYVCIDLVQVPNWIQTHGNMCALILIRCQTDSKHTEICVNLSYSGVEPNVLNWYNKEQNRILAAPAINWWMMAASTVREGVIWNRSNTYREWQWSQSDWKPFIECLSNKYSPCAKWILAFSFIISSHHTNFRCPYYLYPC